MSSSETPSGTPSALPGDSAATVPAAPFTGAVFIATSLDGYIARPDGDIDWLTSRGEQAGETGYDAFIAGVDALVVGRGTYEKVRTFGAWPYPGLEVLLLSSRAEADADDRVTVVRDLGEAVAALDARAARRVHVDGGRVVQSFLAAGLVRELTVTTVPVLLGRGIPLFGALAADVDLHHESTVVLGAGLVQTTYTVVG